MRALGTLCLLLLLCPSAPGGGPEGRYVPVGVLLDGPSGGRPPREVVYEMRGPVAEVVLHLVFERGLYRLSKRGHGRGTTAGVYIEVNEADQPTHPVRNPFVPLPVDLQRNPDWKEYVGREFPFPNPAPGYWYTWGRTKEVLERPLRLHFAQPGRYRIRVRGVTDLRRDDIRAATLAGVTEVPAEAAEAPEANLIQPRSELAVPTGKRETSVLLLERELPDRVVAGRPFRYRLRITNLTDRGLRNVEVRESGSPPLEIRSGAPVDAQGVLVWKAGDLGPRKFKELEIEAVAPRAGSLVRRLRVRWDSRPLVQILDVEEGE